MQAPWQEATLGELIHVKHGYAFKGEYFAAHGTHVVLTPGNFEEGGGFRERADKAKWYEGPVPQDYVLEKGDLIVAMTEQGEGLLGSSAKVPRSGLYLHNQRLGLVTPLDPRQVDKEFLYYLFNSRPVRQQIRASASGAKIRHTSPARIYEVRVRTPDVRSQRRIASILSAYDDLIENNTRRIAILEEMARRIYEEWFVHYRFPGHESVRMVETELGPVPEGWVVLPLQDVLQHSIGGGWGQDSPDEEHSVPAYVIRGTDIPDIRLGSTGRAPLRYHKASNFRSRKLQSRDIVFEVSGGSKDQPVGRAVLIGERLLSRLPEPAICASFCRLIRADEQKLLPELLLLHFERIYKNREIMKYQTQSTGITNFKFKVFLEKEMMITPPASVQAEFAKRASPVLALAEVLGIENTNLRTTRDLLLPRLISGELDVSDLPLPEEASAA